MIIKYHSKFKKQYKKLDSKGKDQFRVRINLFESDPTNPKLRLHPLKGQYGGYWSINISGDLRALFYYESEAIVVFALIGTHSQLYG